VIHRITTLDQLIAALTLVRRSVPGETQVTIHADGGVQVEELKTLQAGMVVDHSSGAPVYFVTLNPSPGG
jgi:hypothetical protein